MPPSFSGTVVSWISAERYTYVAVWTNNTWYITGNGAFYGSNTFTHNEFCDNVLDRPEVSDIQVATGWRTIGLST